MDYVPLVVPDPALLSVIPMEEITTVIMDFIVLNRLYSTDVQEAIIADATGSKYVILVLLYLPFPRLVVVQVVCPPLLPLPHPLPPSP